MASTFARYVGKVGHRVETRDRHDHDLSIHRPVRQPCSFCGVRSDVGCKHSA